MFAIWLLWALGGTLLVCLQMEDLIDPLDAARRDDSDDMRRSLNGVTDPEL